MLEVRWMYMVPAVARYQEEVHEPCSCWLERKKESSAVVVMITNLQFKERDIEGFSDNSYNPQTKSNNLEGKRMLRGPPLQQLRETGEDVWHQYNCKHIQETFLRIKAEFFILYFSSSCSFLLCSCTVLFFYCCFPSIFSCCFPSTSSFTDVFLLHLSWHFSF